jgi:signal transduction histidine kinase
MRESERVKLARSLHDGIAQDLIGVSYRLQSLLALESTSLQMRSTLREAIFDIDALSLKVRDEIYALRNSPEVITLTELHSNLSRLPEGIVVAIQSEIAPEHLIQSELLTIFTELIRNARTHAGATRIEISLESVNDRYRCVVRDNGSGEISVRDGRYGLIGIQELLLEIGGELSIESEGLRRLTLIFPNPQFL